jgi:hypothetical protein
VPNACTPFSNAFSVLKPIYFHLLSDLDYADTQCNRTVSRITATYFAA